MKSELRFLWVMQRSHLLGTINPVNKIMAGLDYLVLSSAFGEGFPNVIGEAMSCEVLCVVTDVGDSKEIVGDTGKVVPPNNPPALAHAILELLELTKEDDKSLRSKARSRIQENFSIDKIVQQYEQLYSCMN